MQNGTGKIHELWSVLRKNLTPRDLYPKRRYPMWTDPVTGLPCRSGPAPMNRHAAPRREAKVIRESESERESLRARLLVRAQTRLRLTETQYRRVALLFGFATPVMSQRDVAAVEGVTKYAVTDAKAQAFDKMERDSYLWLFWLLCKEFNLPGSYKPEAQRGRHAAAVEAGRQKRFAAYARNLHGRLEKTNTEMERENAPRSAPYNTGLYERNPKIGELVQAGHGFGKVGTRPGDDAWESDRFTPRSSYDREIDRLTDEFENGSLTRVEYDRDMILALARQQVPDGDPEDADYIELRQEIEWAIGAREMGGITNRECDRRVSAALRSYVRG